MLKIKKFRELRNLTQDDLSALSGVKKRSLVDYENGKSDIPFSKMRNIAIALGVTVSELIDEKDYTESNRNFNCNQNQKCELNNHVIIPLYNLNSSVGLVPFKVDDGTIDEEKIIEYVSVSHLPSCDGAIYTIGDSMYPLLNSGDIIIYKNIEVDITKILFGKIYVVALKVSDNETVKLVKYIQPSKYGEKFVKLVCGNNHYPDKDVELKEIVAIGIIRASFRYHI